MKRYLIPIVPMGKPRMTRKGSRFTPSAKRYWAWKDELWYACVEAGMDVAGILGIDPDVRNGFDHIRVHYQIDADASADDIEALVAQSQKRSAVFDIITNPTDITVEVN